MACANSNRDDTLGILKQTKQCALNIPTAGLTGKVVACGNTSGRQVDKFERFGLTPSAAERVRRRLPEECHANPECRVHRSRAWPVGRSASRDRACGRNAGRAAAHCPGFVRFLPVRVCRVFVLSGSKDGDRKPGPFRLA
ncbi:MAG: flavin reductase family protein [Acidiferrobacterales bacterium]